MNFYLTNEHRKYMGIKPLKENYEILIFKRDKYEECYLFFDGDKIVKRVEYFKSEAMISMSEDDVNYNTKNNKTIVLPKTSRGKERKLTASVAGSLSGEGVYFYISQHFSEECGEVMIGNYNTQKTFYKNKYIDKCSTYDDFKKWCDKFVAESTEEDLEAAQKFALKKRKHCIYKEGDYFRVRLGRNQYTYGRILLDIYKRRKDNTLEYWDILMGRPLLIEVFHILTTRKDVSIDELKKLKTFPAQHIMDNNFYYGDYEIIGNDIVPDSSSYPIMYGRSIDYFSRNKIMFQCGKIYIEREYGECPYYGQFLNNAISFSIKQDEKIIAACLKANSNQPYWEMYKSFGEDLRNPKNRELLKKILKDYDLEYLLELYEE